MNIEQERKRFEAKYPLPEGVEFNEAFGAYQAGVYSEPSVSKVNNKWEAWQARAAECQEDALWETFIKLADYLGIDPEKARKIPGKPSGVFIAAIEAGPQSAGFRTMLGSGCLVDGRDAQTMGALLRGQRKVSAQTPHANVLLMPVECSYKYFREECMHYSNLPRSQSNPKPISSGIYVVAGSC